jgi:hypothetical protein
MSDSEEGGGRQRRMTGQQIYGYSCHHSHSAHALDFLVATDTSTISEDSFKEELDRELRNLQKPVCHTKLSTFVPSLTVR